MIAIGLASKTLEPGGSENLPEHYLCESPGALEVARINVGRFVFQVQEISLQISLPGSGD